MDLSNNLMQQRRRSSNSQTKTIGNQLYQGIVEVLKKQGTKNYSQTSLKFLPKLTRCKAECKFLLKLPFQEMMLWSSKNQVVPKFSKANSTKSIVRHLVTGTKKARAISSLSPWSSVYYHLPAKALVTADQRPTPKDHSRNNPSNQLNLQKRRQNRCQILKIRCLTSSSAKITPI